MTRDTKHNTQSSPSHGWGRGGHVFTVAHLLDSKLREHRWCNPKGCVGKGSNLQAYNTMDPHLINPQTLAPNPADTSCVVLCVGRTTLLSDVICSHSWVHWIAPGLDRYIGEWMYMVPIINSNNGIKEPAHVCQIWKQVRCWYLVGIIGWGNVLYTCMWGQSTF